MDFYTPNYPALVFQIWRDSLHRLRSYCWETAHQSIRPNFSMHPVWKTMRWIEKWLLPFWWSPCAFYHHAKFGEDCTKCASCVCHHVFFLSVTLRGQALFM